ncbi:tannase/feruloyl esterase family alpha/beta hydrolase [Variovorax terrae]|uniref:Tannase/feruloyl esterase family alpha/beta hydrolase n=1 Tax=Variovorax terrae TaxID=2923278 RepID=A0A9X2APK9_9BURK|nr:tannase/feruloyl esterase family alpha/beta hydrolase [Variovorax terrae]MCJ0762156.1 tannase/feruloyl esterase family alpha/beta hydrolase [Variovorax terrae]
MAAILAGCGGGGDSLNATSGGSGGGTTPPPVDSNAIASLPAVPDNLAIAPKLDCTMAGIGATQISADAPASILSVSTGTASGTAYCLVKLKVDPAVNIWVTLPSSNWNGRFRAEGNGVYAGGTPAVASDSVRQGFVGVTTDTGHSTNALSGAFGMNADGTPNTQLQADFAYRSEHLMAVVGKQITKAFYGQDALRSYWYGCSTGGRQGLRMAQQFPEDYDAILAGAPAVHWDRFQAFQIWPQVVYKSENVTPLSSAKTALATSRAVAACDASDGVVDGVIGDPRACTYDPRQDATITRAGCTSADGTCLSPAEATSVQKIWNGARNVAGDLLWPGIERGADIGSLGGAAPFPIPTEQARYWVYFDPTWDWRTLTYQNYETFFNDNIRMVGPMMASDNPDLSMFRKRGGKLIMHHGWADQLIMPQGTVKYYNAMQQQMGSTDDFARLYMVPGMGHCSGGAGTDSFGQGSSGAVPMTADRDIFRSLMAWSEKGAAPKAITASKVIAGVTTRTRPLCPYPQVARYKGSGSTDDASSFVCAAP